MALSCCFGRSHSYTVNRPSGRDLLRHGVPKDRRVSTTPITQQVERAVDETYAKIQRSISTEFNAASNVHKTMSHLNLKGKAEGSSELLETVVHRLVGRVCVNSRETHHFVSGLVSLTIGKNESFGKVGIADSHKAAEITLYLTVPSYHDNMSFSVEMAVTREIRSQVSTQNSLYKVCAVLEQLCLGKDAKFDLMLLLKEANELKDDLPFHVLAVLTTLARACEGAYVDTNRYKLGSFEASSAKQLFTDIMAGNMSLIKTSSMPLLHNPKSPVALVEAEKAKNVKILDGAYKAMEVVKECLIKCERTFVFDFADETLG